MKKITENVSIYLVCGCTMIALLFTLGLYFYNFHGDFSLVQSDWGAFATFFAGILTPFLSFLNVIIFIKLTFSLEKERDEKNEKSLKIKRQESLLQIRIEKIKNFDNAIKKTIGFSTVPDVNLIKIATSETLSLFTDLELFFDLDILAGREFCDRLFKLYDILDEYDKKGIRYLNNVSSSDFRLIYNLEKSIVNNLYAVTLGKKVMWLDYEPGKKDE